MTALILISGLYLSLIALVFISRPKNGWDWIKTFTITFLIVLAIIVGNYVEGI